MCALPTGTVVFLFTDIEGSTRLWQEHHDQMPGTLARHHQLLRHAILSHSGYIFQIVGDAFCAAFATAPDALAAALDAQRALRDEPWGDIGPLRIRMALHTGEVQAQEGDFTSGEYASGLTLSRTSRLLSAAHGGQILLSAPTAELVRHEMPSQTILRDLGAHRLKDLIQPELIFQVVAPDLPEDFPRLRTFDALPNNLPVQLTTFIGRESEMLELKQLLKATRLVTLTGSGGTGKTRLSLEVAADLMEDFKDGVWFIELAPLSASSQVIEAAAAVLGVREEQGRPLIKTLLDYLRDKQALLVLDNCEHLIDACAAFAEQVLRAGSGVRILASSREPLGIPGESSYRVPSLPAPNPAHRHAVDQLQEYASVRLFVDRATQALPTFNINEANAGAVAQICFRLDGIPLAMELAAARVRSLPVERIAERLDDRFRLLTGGSRTALPRQRTLRALFDWSHDLLTEPERTLFRRLAIFPAGWALEAAEFICADELLGPDQVLDLLGSLVDKSLVTTEAPAGIDRYGMLETVRQYALEKLDACADRETTAARHFDFFLALIAQAEPKLSGPEQRDALARFDQEYDNLRAALDWSLTANRVGALRMANHLGHFWQIRGRISEGRAMIERALQAAPSAPVESRAYGHVWRGTFFLREGENIRAKHDLDVALGLSRECGDQAGTGRALRCLGIVAHAMGDYEQADEYSRGSLEIERERGDKRAIASLLSNLGMNATGRGEFAAAREYLEQSVAAVRELGDALGLAASLNNLGYAAEAQGDLPAAVRSYQESIALLRDQNEKMVQGYVLNGLAHVLYLQGHGSAAADHYRQSLALANESGDKRLMVYCLEGLARLALKADREAVAARLLSAASAFRQQAQMPLDRNEQLEYERDVATAKRALGEQSYRAAWAEGQVMMLERALQDALEHTGHDQPAGADTA